MINQSIQGGSMVWLKPKFGQPKKIMVTKVLSDTIYINEKRLEHCKNNSFALGVLPRLGTIYPSEDDYKAYLAWCEFVGDAFYLNLSNEQKKRILEIVKGN